MSDLDRAHTHLKDLVKRHLEVNAILDDIESMDEFDGMIEAFKKAFAQQINKLLKSGVFADIDGALHPVQKADPKKDATPIFTDSDYLEIQDYVSANMQPIANQHDHKFADMFADFLILVFNRGGQDFLNRQNIPRTFELTNESTIGGIKKSADVTMKGIDQTTQKWITDQIADGRKAGLSNSDIADNIRDAVPDTYANRSEKIVLTETSRMVGEAEYQTASNNGASHKEWVTVAGACDICVANEQAGVIGIDQAFPSGDLKNPAHPYCRCDVEYVFNPFMGSVWSGQ